MSIEWSGWNNAVAGKGNLFVNGKDFQDRNEIPDVQFVRLHQILYGE